MGLLLTSLTLQSQTQSIFEYGRSGLLPEYLVTEIPKTQGELFTLSANWIKETFNRPDQVIMTTIDTSMIRLEAMTPFAIHYLNAFGDLARWDARYIIEISLKPGKYRFFPIALYEVGMTGPGFPIDLRDGAKFYTKAGELRKGSAPAIISIQDLFNSLNASLRSYIENGPNRDW